MVANQIHVVVVGPTPFEDGHDNSVTVGRGSSCGDVPCLVGIDVVVRSVHMVPLGTKLRIVGGCPVLHIVVQLGRHHRGQRLDGAQHLLAVRAGIPKAEQVNGRQFTQRLTQHQPLRQPLRKGTDRSQVLGLGFAIEFDNELARHRRA